MRKHPKLRGLLCGILLGATILCLFVSTFAALGCLLLALLICPASGIDRFVMRTLPRGGMRFLVGLIAVLLCGLGFALTLTTEPESAVKQASTEAAESTADPVQTAEPTAVTNPLDTALTIYPADTSILLAVDAQPLTADILDGSTVPEFGTVFYIDGEVLLSINNEYARGVVIETECGSVTLVVGRIAYDGGQLVLSQDDADSLPMRGAMGRFFLTYQTLPSEPDGSPILLYGADDLTVAAIQTYASNLQGQDTSSSTVAPEPAESATAAEPMNTYACNVSSKVFHRPSCSSVEDMADYNKQTETCYASTLIAMGYTPCSKCNPN